MKSTGQEHRVTDSGAIAVSMLRNHFVGKLALTLIQRPDIPSFMSTSKKPVRKNAHAKQTAFADARFRNELRFGGSLLTKAKNRHARPIASKDPMHLVLRSSKAKGRFGLAHSSNLRRVNDLVRKHCAKYGVKLIEYSNNFNHLHLLVKFPSRAVYLRFIRSLTGSLALAVTGANRNKGLASILSQSSAQGLDRKAAKGFWDFRPFSRVVRSLRGYRVTRDYVVLNQLEALSILPKRKGRLRDVDRSERHLFRSQSAG